MKYLAKWMATLQDWSHQSGDYIFRTEEDARRGTDEWVIEIRKEITKGTYRRARIWIWRRAFLSREMLVLQIDLDERDALQGGRT